MNTIIKYIKSYQSWLQFPEFNIGDLIEIFIIAFAIYQIIIWIKKSRAWILLKGLVVLLGVCAVAVVCRMNVILWIFEKCIGVGFTALVIVFQPELRKALEQLGRNRFFKSIVLFDDQKSKNRRFWRYRFLSCCIG